MTWKSHKLVSAAIAYAIGLPLEGIIAVTIGSITPDFIEFVFKIKHRGVSHFWGIYALVFLFATYHALQQPIAGLIIKWTSLGCLLHIFEDAMSKAGIPMFPGTFKRIKLGQLYKTKYPSEAIVVLAIIVLCGLVKAIKIYLHTDTWQPVILFWDMINHGM